MKPIFVAVLALLAAGGAAFAQGGGNYDKFVDICANNGEVTNPMSYCTCNAGQLTTTPAGQ